MNIYAMLANIVCLKRTASTIGDICNRFPEMFIEIVYLPSLCLETGIFYLEFLKCYYSMAENILYINAIGMY